MGTYRDYLQSKEWQARRAKALNRAGYSCESCGDSGDLEVHHLHYLSVGNEGPEALMALCQKCHELYGPLSKLATQLFRALNTYVRKKFGEDWKKDPGFDVAADDFFHWVDRKIDRGAWHWSGPLPELSEIEEIIVRSTIRERALGYA